MSTKLKRSETAKILGVTYGGLKYLQLKNLQEHRDELGRPYFEKDEVEAWIAEQGWTGSRARKPLEKHGERRALRKGRFVAQALAMIRDGYERTEIIIALECPIDWIDQAYTEFSQTFESAAERRVREMQLRESAEERREGERQQRMLEKTIREDVKRRRAKK